MKETQEEKREKLDRAFEAVKEAAGIKNWPEFAEFVNMPYPSVYRVVTGRTGVTDSFIRRLTTELALKGISLDGEPVAIAQNVSAPVAQNNTAPVTQTTEDARWFDLVAEKDNQISRLLGIIENMQK